MTSPREDSSRRGEADEFINRKVDKVHKPALPGRPDLAIQAGTSSAHGDERNDYRQKPGGPIVVDLHETPAVPPMDPGGDERLGYFIAGGLLIFLGWAVGVLGNYLIHVWAGPGGMVLGWVHVNSTWGAYGYAALGFGLFTGAVGVVLLAIGRASPKAPLVLPGFDY